MNTNHESTVEGLCRMLDEETVTAATWTPDDLRAMLDHQLRVDLATDLVPVVPNAEATLSTQAPGTGDAPRTFGDVLAHPSPPVHLLSLIKDFAKGLRQGPDRGLPDDLLLVLYYGALVAAAVRAGTSITTLADRELARGCRWCLDRDWLTPALRALFKEGCARLPNV